MVSLVLGRPDFLVQPRSTLSDPAKADVGQSLETPSTPRDRKTAATEAIRPQSIQVRPSGPPAEIAQVPGMPSLPPKR
ncbi:MAG: hypothetical protein ABI453_12950 [Isosphaeraceae bacterium]